MGRPYGLIPVGVVGLVNALRSSGIPVKGLNLPLEFRIDRGFDLCEWLSANRQARVVLIDLHWYEHAFGTIDVARVCREVLPRAWVVIGGLTASAFAEAILSAHPAVDYVVRGDAEGPLLELVPRLLSSSREGSGFLSLVDIPNLSYREGDLIVENPLAYCATSEHLDRLDLCDLGFLEHAWHYAVHQYVVPGPADAVAVDPRKVSGHWLCIARGCSHECSYCGGCRTAHRTLAGREGVVTRAPTRVAQDLARLERSGLVQVALSYDPAELGEEYWEPLFAEMDRLSVRIGIYNEFFQMPSDGFVEAFAQRVVLPHTCVALSPLSGSERVRRLNGKHFDDDALFHTLSLLRAHDVAVLIYFSLNLPGEDESSFEETLSLARRIYDFYPTPLLKILDTLHTLDPLSPMAVTPDKFGIRVTMRTFADYYRYCAMTAQANPEARSGSLRGYATDAQASLSAMADRWDDLCLGREKTILPTPASW